MKKYFFIILSLFISLSLITTFISYTIASHNEIPAKLVDISGDTSGIHNLTINGLVVDYRNNYAYDFNIKPDAWASSTEVDVRVHNSSGSAKRDSINYISPFMYSYLSSEYIPINPYKTETVVCKRVYATDRDGEPYYPYMEKRIYAEVFEVRLKYNILLGTDESKGKLYRNASDEEFIYSIIYNGRDQDIFENDFGTNHSARLESELRIDDKILLVQNGKGFFGHTAVYVINAPGGEMPVVQNYNADNESYLATDELYPIELKLGDEILGMMKLNDGIILFIKRSQYFEAIRIDVKTGESIKVVADGETDFYTYHLSEDSLVLRRYISEDNFLVWAFELKDKNIKLTMQEQRIKLSDDAAYGTFYEIIDAVFKNGVLYTAFSANNNYSPTTLNISAFNTEGLLVGSCKLMCGIEEDYKSFSMNDGSVVQSSQVRSLQSVTIR